ncbi:hypothetical protein NPIL_219171 [Nephila pilipes]|uniref:Uncharacterized protein n=1 Tax=Nephila pilipes TaxID=299642 RepID=A0A8X6UIX3_NEPPI|nr:hypothetical protein NPIL_219171 [Nephila pilipes]
MRKRLRHEIGFDIARNGLILGSKREDLPGRDLPPSPPFTEFDSAGSHRRRRRPRAPGRKNGEKGLPDLLIRDKESRTWGGVDSSEGKKKENHKGVLGGTRLLRITTEEEGRCCTES